jgi:hypothetical protein
MSLHNLNLGRLCCTAQPHTPKGGGGCAVLMHSLHSLAQLVGSAVEQKMWKCKVSANQTFIELPPFSALAETVASCAGLRGKWLPQATEKTDTITVGH